MSELVAQQRAGGARRRSAHAPAGRGGAPGGHAEESGLRRGKRRTHPGTERESGAEHLQKLRDRLTQLLSQAEMDPQRLAQEAALIADKCDISEEIARLKSHIEQYRSLMDAKEKAGKKLDFLLQELQREANTILVQVRRSGRYRAAPLPSRPISKSFANRFRTLSDMAGSGNLIIVSGPSGAGKSILASRVLQADAASEVFCFLHDTSAARIGAERGGIFFRRAGRSSNRSSTEMNLLEWAEVHGNYYGTSRRFVDDLMRQGEDVLLDIDVQGASIVRQKRPDAVGVFILPPSYQVLRERLMRRSLDPGFVIEQRLKIARKEIRHYRDYDYLISQ